MTDKINIVISYVEEDIEYKNQLLTHFTPLKYEGVTFWDKSKINAGDTLSESQKVNILDADIILILVSADYIATNELNYTISLALEKGIEVIPILVRSCAWQEDKVLSELNILPENGSPISTPNKKVSYDDVYLEVTNSIRKTINRLRIVKLNNLIEKSTLFTKLKQQVNSLEQELESKNKVIENQLLTLAEKNRSNENIFNKKLEKQNNLLEDLIPIGTIFSWCEYTKEIKLNENWVRCEGQIIEDIESPLNGKKIPDLNGQRLFLRGGEKSGEIQSENWKTLKVHSSKGVYQHEKIPIPKNGQWSKFMYTGKWGAEKTDNKWEANRLQFRYESDCEIRPKNMSVIYIMRIK